MNRIIVLLFALAFVQLVSSQAACSDAQTALLNNSTCLTTIDVATLCNGTCRTIFDNIRSNCDNDTAASVFLTLFDSRCSPCAIAQSAYIFDDTCSNESTRCTEKCRDLFEDYRKNCLKEYYGTNGVSIFIPCDDTADACKKALDAIQETTVCTTACTGTACRGLLNDIIINCDTRTPAGDSATVDDFCDSGTTTRDACDIATEAVDDACFTLLGLGDNSTCTGTCGSQLATAVAACTTTSGGDIRAASTTYNELCGFQVQCSASIQAFSASTCDYDQQNGDTSVICSGTCRSLVEGILNSCQESYTIATLRRELNLACGGSGSEVLQASEIITLLLMAICAFIF